MSLFSSIILPKLEKELTSMEPEIAQFLIKQLKLIAGEVIDWIEEKFNLDLDGDGEVG